jgi:hypothetical protein
MIIFLSSLAGLMKHIHRTLSIATLIGIVSFSGVAQDPNPGPIPQEQSAKASDDDKV